MDINTYVDDFLSDKGISKDYKLHFPGSDIELAGMLKDFYKYSRERLTGEMVKGLGAVLATSEDVDILINSIENPPEPGEGLRDAQASFLKHGFKDIEDE